MKTHVARILILTALLPKLWAGSNWTSIGPFGAAIQCLAIDPQNPATLYAGTQTGLFKSTDRGTSWDKINSALNVFSIAINPRTPSTLYASSYGVFKSVDGGATWMPAISGLPGLGFSLPLVDVTALVIDPQNPETLYAGTRLGIYKSQNGGASWTATNSGQSSVPNGPASPLTQVRRLTIDPQNPSTVYAIANFQVYVNGNVRGFSNGIFKTTDGGDSWKAQILPDSRPPGLPSSVSTLTIDLQNPSTLYAFGGFPSGLFKTTDGGANWSVVNSTIVGFSLAIDPHGSNTLYAGTSRGILKSTDAGTSWTEAGSGQRGGSIIVIDPQDTSIVYASGGAGLIKTIDGGTNWTEVNAGLSTVVIQTLALDPQNPNSIYATHWELLKSTDAGSHWSRVNATPDFYPASITMDPRNPGVVYAAGWFGDAEGPPYLIFKSSDGGGSWSRAMSGLPNFLYVNALVIDSTNTKTVYAASDRGVFKSIDAAASWNVASTGLPGTDISTLAVDPRNSDTVYAGGGDGAFKSTDSGASWNALDIPANHSISVLAIDPQNPSTVYAGGAGTIFKSRDAGKTWTESDAGLPGNPNWMSALVIDPQNPNTLYAGTSGASFDPCGVPCGGFNDGVFKSTDAGATWTAVNSGLTTTQVSSLAIDPQNPSRLYAGTIGGGVFSITFGPPPVVTDFRFNLTKVAAGGSYSATISGSNLTSQTFFDVRFNAPGSSASDVVLNWQKGLIASHEAPAGIAAGTWTVTGVRAHELESDHTDSFVPVSAAITVSN